MESILPQTVFVAINGCSLQSVGHFEVNLNSDDSTDRRIKDTEAHLQPISIPILHQYNKMLYPKFEN